MERLSTGKRSLARVVLAVLSVTPAAAGAVVGTFHPRNVHGTGAFHFALDESTQRLLALTVATPYGNLRATVDRNVLGEMVRVSATLEGATTTFTSELSDDPALDALVVHTDFGEHGSFAYDVAAAREPPVRLIASDIPDCRALQDSELFKAVMEAYGTAGDLFHSGRVVPVRRGAVGASMLVLSLLGPAVIQSPQCAIGPTWPLYTPFDPCWMISPSNDECAKCCSRNKKGVRIGSAIPVAVATAADPVAGGGAAAILVVATEAEEKACLEACDETFPAEPPGEGGRCGSLTFTGECRRRQACRGGHGICSVGDCADDLVCCCEGWDDPGPDPSTP